MGSVNLRCYPEINIQEHPMRMAKLFTCRSHRRKFSVVVPVEKVESSLQMDGHKVRTVQWHKTHVGVFPLFRIPVFELGEHQTVRVMEGSLFGDLAVTLVTSSAHSCSATRAFFTPVEPPGSGPRPQWIPKPRVLGGNAVLREGRRANRESILIT